MHLLLHMLVMHQQSPESFCCGATLKTPEHNQTARLLPSSSQGYCFWMVTLLLEGGDHP
jgi:hypothetical protein